MWRLQRCIATIKPLTNKVKQKEKTMRNSDLNNKPFFLKDSKGALYAQAALSTLGPYVYSDGCNHVVISGEEWDNWSDAGDDLGVVGISLTGGMAVQYTSPDLAEALNDITVRIDLLRRRMIVPIRLLTREEFMMVSKDPASIREAEGLTLSEADGHLGVFREEIDRGQVNTTEEGGVILPMQVFGSVMLYKNMLADKMDAFENENYSFYLCPVTTETSIIFFVVYGNFDNLTEEDPDSNKES